MKCLPICNTNFNGVKLSNSSYENSCLVNDVLTHKDFNVLGHKTFYVNNTFETKRNLANYVRDRNYFGERRCGVVMLPWSGETWIISNVSNEQKIKNVLDSFSIGNVLNLSI